MWIWSDPMLEISNTLSGQKRFWFRKSKSTITLSRRKCMRGLCSPWLALLVALQTCVSFHELFSEQIHCATGGSVEMPLTVHPALIPTEICTRCQLIFSFVVPDPYSLIQPHNLFFICEELQALYINSCVLLVYQCCLGSSQSLICNWNKIVAV